MIRRALPVLALFAVALFVADAATACAVCNGGEDVRTQQSYLNATIFMIVFPLSVIGGGVWMLRRRIRAVEESTLPRD